MTQSRQTYHIFTSEIRVIVLLIYTVGQRYMNRTTLSIIDSNSLNIFSCYYREMIIQNDYC